MIVQLLDPHKLGCDAFLELMFFKEFVKIYL
jgi:hypothetical protein